MIVDPSKAQQEQAGLTAHLNKAARSARREIHAAAIVEAGATLGAGVVGPFSVIGPEVVLGDNVRVYPMW